MQMRCNIWRKDKKYSKKGQWKKPREIKERKDKLKGLSKWKWCREIKDEQKWWKINKTWWRYMKDEQKRREKWMKKMNKWKWYRQTKDEWKRMKENEDNRKGNEKKSEE